MELATYDRHLQIPPPFPHQNHIVVAYKHHCFPLIDCHGSIHHRWLIHPQTWLPSNRSKQSTFKAKILVNLQVSALFYLVLTDLASGEIKCLLQQRVPDPSGPFHLILSTEDTGNKLSVRTKHVLYPTTQNMAAQHFRFCAHMYPSGFASMSDTCRRAVGAINMVTRQSNSQRYGHKAKDHWINKI